MPAYATPIGFEHSREPKSSLPRGPAIARICKPLRLQDQDTTHTLPENFTLRPAETYSRNLDSRNKPGFFWRSA
jgi:hypothetical protein